MNTQTKTTQGVYPSLRYNDAKVAIAWLTSVLGFRAHEVCEGDNDSIAHAELEIAGNLIMVGSVKGGSQDKSPSGIGAVTGGVYIRLARASDVEAYYDRAKAGGAEIVRELCDTDYGSREFSASDSEGHRWSFGTYRPQATSESE